jgi:phosphoglycolate phosphatase
MATTLVFDLDGTLIDSAPDLHRALLRLLNQEGLPAIPLDAVIGMVGDGAAKLVARAFAHAGRPVDAELPHLLARFLDLYETGIADLTRPYPGVPETLKILQDAGHRMAVCTNKPDAPTRAVLDALGLGGFFDAAIGGDAAPAKKPDPRHVLAVLQRMGESTENSVMIGDGANDLLVARAAGIAFVHARYGYGIRGVADVLPAAAIDAFSDLPSALTKLEKKIAGH